MNGDRRLQLRDVGAHGGGLTPSQAARADQAFAAFGRADAVIEVRPGPSDSAEWHRNASAFMLAAAVSAVTLAASAPSEARSALNGVSSAATQQKIPAEVSVLAAASLLPDGTIKPLPSVVVRIQGEDYLAMHPIERVRLCQEVSRAERLSAYGRDWRDVYAVVSAETSWAARDGKGVNGRASVGLGQLEGPTAKALGIVDPREPRQAVTATARLVVEGAQWARARHVDLQDAAISVHYNLSTAARNAWDGRTLDALPIQTQQHVANFIDGRRLADVYGRQLAQFDSAVAQLRQQAAAAHEQATPESLPPPSSATRMGAGALNDFAAQIAAALAPASAKDGVSVAAAGGRTGADLLAMADRVAAARRQLPNLAARMGVRAERLGALLQERPFAQSVEHRSAAWKLARDRLVAMVDVVGGGLGMAFAAQPRGTSSAASARLVAWFRHEESDEASDGWNQHMMLRERG